MNVTREVTNLSPILPELRSPGDVFSPFIHRTAQNVARIDEGIMGRGS
jgi:hypothetical protein